MVQATLLGKVTGRIGAYLCDRQDGACLSEYLLPHGAAKEHGYWKATNYRERYGIHASNLILFHHESLAGGETLVTHKIIGAPTRIVLAPRDRLYHRNPDLLRNWGFTRNCARVE